MADISKTIYFLNKEQEERHTKEIAQKIGIPYIDLTGYPISPDVLNLIPKELSLQHQVVPYLRIGSNVKISRFASLYGPERMSIGNNVRIDDFSIVSGNVTLGNYVHIASYVGLFGRYGITFQDFSGASTRATVLSGSDDYSGDYLTNPTVPEEYTNVIGKPVTIGRHCLIGAGAIVLPGVIMGEGSCAGALSLVKNDLEPWNIYGGVPCRLLKPRSRELLKLERELLNER
jgi:galactoside O-acetyltransferase